MEQRRNVYNEIENRLVFRRSIESRISGGHFSQTRIELGLPTS